MSPLWESVLDATITEFTIAKQSLNLAPTIGECRINFGRS